MSFSGTASGFSSYSSTPDVSRKSLISLLPPEEPLVDVKPKHMCAGTDCILVTLLTGMVLIFVCIVAQISIIAQADSMLSAVCHLVF